MASPKLGFSTAWWLSYSRNTTRDPGKMISLMWTSFGSPRTLLLFILMVRQVTEASPVTRGEELDFIYWWRNARSFQKSSWDRKRACRRFRKIPSAISLYCYYPILQVKKCGNSWLGHMVSLLI